MIRFLADENFDRRIVQALRRTAPHIDVALAQEVGLTGVTDPVLLAWAATDNRILLSHDYKTLPLHARRRIEASQPVSGILLMQRSLPPAKAAEEIALRGECTDPADWESQIEYLHP